MNGPQLNLARKWRSKSFDQVVGQLLPVRMLKNSLYLESFFPVYLFSGQRGCGKTTMARIFATAINCEKLSEFQKNPKNNAMPCLICSSCAAMIEGHHPDFIEIDAASHTGVDNVRNIIDAASLMPIMGRKKIYLIDEAHMLSKAAFNAFLKILEEPPASVLFILATTDAQKIIDTVRSRCFQLFFGPVDAQPLLNHLIAICEKENIHYDQQGLKLIVDSTEGSVRDAINLLEQVRFSTNNVTKQAVLVSLGHLDDERIVALLNTLLLHSCADVLKYTEKNKLQLYSADFLWQKLSDMVRALVWIKHGVKPHFFTEYNTQLSALAGACSLERLNNILEIFYSNETVFKKTTAQYALLEMIFLKISQKNSVDDNSGASSIPQQVASDDEELVEDMDDEGIEDDEGEEEETDEEVDAQVISFNALWAQFLKQVPSLQDALLNSLFSQAACQSYDNDTAQLHVIFSKELAFFKDWLTNTNAKWQPLLDGSFGKPVILVAQFTGTEIKKTVKVDTVASVSHKLEPKLVPVSNKAQEQKSSVQQAKPAIKPVQSNPPQPYKKQDNKYSSFRKNNFAKTEPLNPRIDVSDKSIWKKANLVLHYFPGVMREIKENIHEQKA
jgi:DNA polymerase-3 subunit gamma/tau